MIKEIKENNYKICEFKPFVEYIGELDQKEIKFNGTYKKNMWMEFHFECENVFYKITIIKYDEDKNEVVTISKYTDEKEMNKFEQIIFKKYIDETHENAASINYSAHFDNDEFTSLINSCYIYKNNELVDAWREIRKIPIEEFKNIYHVGDNMDELIKVADNCIFDFVEVKSEKKDEIKELKLHY